MPRPWHLPTDPADAVLHIIGDLHFKADTRDNVNLRAQRVLDDLADGSVPAVDLRVQTGDWTEDALTGEFTASQGYMAALAAVDGAPFYTCLGNHDMYDPARGGSAAPGPSPLTRAQAATALGISQTYAVNIGDDWRLLVFNPATYGTYAQADVDWLDAALAATTRKCVILTHYPLKGTVTGQTDPPYPIFSSNSSDFHAVVESSGLDTAIRNVLAARSNAKVYIAGHTHSPVTSPGVVSAVSLGGRNVAHVNGSAIAYVGAGRTNGPQPIRSAYLWLYEDRAEVRFRDHGFRCPAHFAPGVEAKTVTF